VVVNTPIPIPPVTGAAAAINLLTVYFQPEGMSTLTPPFPTILTRWKRPTDPMDAYFGRVAQTPNLWHPAHDLTIGPDGKLYGTDFVPEDH
jgi:hypothetical protein